MVKNGGPGTMKASEWIYIKLSTVCVVCVVCVLVLCVGVVCCVLCVGVRASHRLLILTQTHSN